MKPKGKRRIQTDYEKVVAANIIDGMEKFGWTQVKLAEVTGKNNKQINEILKSRKGSVVNLVPLLAPVWHMAETDFFVRGYFYKAPGESDTAKVTA